MRGAVMSGCCGERAVLDLLLARYTSIRRGTIADRWVRAEFVSSRLGHAAKGLSRVADFIAADRYPGHPYGSSLALHGHEVKVSRGDWLAERGDLSKSEPFRRYMHHWWLVVSDAGIVRPGELPADWGLMAKAGGRLRVVVAAPRLAAEPVPLDLTISLMAAAARTAYRDPLRRDAPSAVSDQRGLLCGFCGASRPCPIHQPRLVGADA